MEVRVRPTPTKTGQMTGLFFINIKKFEMHILSIDQFNEKLTATSVSLSDLNSIKIDKAKKPSVMERRLTNALSHLIDGYAYTFDQKGIITSGYILYQPKVPSLNLTFIFSGYFCLEWYTTSSVPFIVQ